MVKNMHEEQDDEVIIDHTDLDDSVVVEESQKETIQKLREKLKKAQEEKQEYLTGWQRAKADFVNLRKRDEEEKESFLKFSLEKIILELIPVLESFEQAMKTEEKEHDSAWKTGMESIEQQLLSILGKYGVKQLRPEGEFFDPSTHEAISVVPTQDKDLDGKIHEVFQTGSELNGKVIRPAKVTVSEYHG